MKIEIIKYSQFLVFALVLYYSSSVFAADFDGEKSRWKGFGRYDFEVDGRAARVVLPKQYAPGKPWLWRARFPEWHTDTDSILLSRGYMIAYINTDNLYGSPSAIILNSKDYHKLRAGIRNSFIKFENEKKGRVAFLGGSITYNGGWRDSICNYLKNRFPDTDFDFIAAGIPSMGSTPAAFRLKRDILKTCILLHSDKTFIFNR